MEVDIPPIDNSVESQKLIRQVEITEARYVNPPHLVTASHPDMTAPDVVLTSICWLVGRRPAEIAVWTPALSPDQTAALERALASPRSDQVIVFTGMGGLMTLAKELFKGTRSNEEYLKLRWKALCATTSMPNIWEDSATPRGLFNMVVDYLIDWQNWIKSHTTLRQKLLGYCLNNTETSSVVRGALDQVKMIIKDYGLKATLLMESFIMTGSKAIFLDAIAQQAVDLKKALQDLRAKHKESFPYTRVYPLEGSERLNHRLYPDLYYAAIKYSLENKELGQEGRFIMTEVQTTISKRLIDDVLLLRYQVVPTMSEVTKENLRTLGIDPEMARRRQREEEGDEYERGPRRRL